MWVANATPAQVGTVPCYSYCMGTLRKNCWWLVRWALVALALRAVRGAPRRETLPFLCVACVRSGGVWGVWELPTWSSEVACGVGVSGRLGPLASPKTGGFGPAIRGVEGGAKHGTGVLTRTEQGVLTTE